MLLLVACCCSSLPWDRGAAPPPLLLHELADPPPQLLLVPTHRQQALLGPHPPIHHAQQPQEEEEPWSWSSFSALPGHAWPSVGHVPLPAYLVCVEGCGRESGGPVLLVIARPLHVAPAAPHPPPPPQPRRHRRLSSSSSRNRRTDGRTGPSLFPSLDRGGCCRPPPRLLAARGVCVD